MNIDITPFKIKNILSTLVLSISLLMASQANAGLIERTITVTGGTGVDAYYDDVLDITWLKDANYAKTSGYDSDGRMTWDNANTWAADLTIGDFSDWRLTSLAPINGSSFNTDLSYDGTSDRGYNITSTMSELAYMFHVNLGLEGTCDGASTGTTCNQSGTGSHNTSFNTAISLTDMNYDIDNLISYVYWNDTEYAPSTSVAWAFYTVFGYQYNYGVSNSVYGWAVRSGDVGAPSQDAKDVPEPTTLAIFGLGLLGLVVRRRNA